MAEVGRWKPYTQRLGQLLPAFLEDALDPGDPVFVISDAVDSLALTPPLRGEWNLVCAAFNLRRPCAFAIACGWRTRAKPRRRRAVRNSAAGRRGRPRSAYEAPRAAVDRSTRFIGAESKRRGCPRLPAPPSRVMLLVSVRT